MPKAIKLTDASQGHCWAPTLPLAGSPDVLIEGQPAVRQGDPYNPHIPGCTPVPTTHPVVAAMGSGTVYVNGRPLVRDGDALSCGDVAAALAPGTVFVDGGGIGSQLGGTDTGTINVPGLGEVPAGDTIGYALTNPVLTYPTMVVEYSLSGTVNNEFVVAQVYPSEVLVDVIHSTLVEEYSNRNYPNYPGAPKSEQSGSPDLPSYAPEWARQPIALQPYEVVDIHPGLTLDGDTGRIYGTLPVPWVEAQRDIGQTQMSVFVQNFPDDPSTPGLQEGSHLRTTSTISVVYRLRL